jgi:hypothetical protein
MAALPCADWQLMFYVPQERADEAWCDGAHLLSKACERADGDITPESLLERIKSGNLTLLGHLGGWAAVQVQVYPTKKVLHVEAIHAPGVTSADVFGELRAFARHNGCAEIQGACTPAVARLWKRKFGFREAYTIMRTPT